MPSISDKDCPVSPRAEPCLPQDLWMEKRKGRVKGMVYGWFLPAFPTPVRNLVIAQHPCPQMAQKQRG